MKKHDREKLEAEMASWEIMSEGFDDGLDIDDEMNTWELGLSDMEEEIDDGDDLHDYRDYGRSSRPPRYIRRAQLEAFDESTFQHNPQIDAAWEALISDDQHVWITGPAGTGKSTLLRRFLHEYSDTWNIVVTAPTGVAAINVGGETIHHFLHLRPGDDRPEVLRAAAQNRQNELYRNLDILVIDEISMVRADFFDQIDLFLRRVRRNDQAFGGVRLVCFGDLFQLPPVVTDSEPSWRDGNYHTPYYFSSEVFARLQAEQPENLSFIELQEIYRQEDREFIALLQQIRTNCPTREALAKFNERVIDPAIIETLGDDFIILTTRKDAAEAINRRRLNQLPGQAMRFSATSKGRFNQSSQPTLSRLYLKPGARVMLLNNDSDGRWVNGTMATITEIYGTSVLVRLDSGEQYEVESHTWEATEATFDRREGKLVRQVVGEFRQLPLKLAWAITIHKSQGQTFEKLVIDLGDGAFASGQTYVALSRATSLDGLYLTRPLRRADIICDDAVVQFHRSFFERDGKLATTYAAAGRAQITAAGSQETIF